MDEIASNTCPICLVPLVTPIADAKAWSVMVHCLNCGIHCLEGGALEEAKFALKTPERRAAVAHAVRKIKVHDPITDIRIAQLSKTAKLPTAGECLENLVLDLADRASPGTSVQITPRHMQASWGTLTEEAADWVLKEAIAAGWVDQTSPAVTGPGKQRLLRLAFKGWERRDQLLRAGARSRHAFMAMDFNAPDVRYLLEQHLKPEAKQAGFDLRTTEHAQKTAGLIDNRMRVEIRTARFVVVDLTHHNRGAYWEAGFAEGIGRPVFYVCREDVLKAKDNEGKPHFDTAHQTIVAWRPDTMAEAAAELKAMIRSTLPDEAKMQDTPAGSA